MYVLGFLSGFVMCEAEKKETTNISITIQSDEQKICRLAFRIQEPLNNVMSFSPSERVFTRKLRYARAKKTLAVFENWLDGQTHTQQVHRVFAMSPNVVIGMIPMFQRLHSFQQESRPPVGAPAERLNTADVMRNQDAK